MSTAAPVIAPKSGIDTGRESATAPDPAADFAAIYDAHARDVYRTAHAVLRDPHLAEDVTHEVFIRYWRRPDAFDAARGELHAYLRVMARSAAVDAWRRARSAGRRQDRLESEAEATTEAAEDAFTLAERAERATALRAAVRQLPEAQREAIALAYWGGLTADVISRTSGAPLGTVKSRIRLGLARLHEAHAAPA